MTIRAKSCWAAWRGVPAGHALASVAHKEFTSPQLHSFATEHFTAWRPRRRFWLAFSCRISDFSHARLLRGENLSGFRPKGQPADRPAALIVDKGRVGLAGVEAVILAPLPQADDDEEEVPPLFG